MEVYPRLLLECWALGFPSLALSWARAARSESMAPNRSSSSTGDSSSDSLSSRNVESSGRSSSFVGLPFDSPNAGPLLRSFEVRNDADCRDEV